MRLLKVSFKNYKILEEREFEFGENPLVLSAPNETGKSTLIEGIMDAFSLSPDKLRAKRTEGKELDPVRSTLRTERCGSREAMARTSAAPGR